MYHIGTIDRRAGARRRSARPTYAFTIGRRAAAVKADFVKKGFFADVPADSFYYEAVKWAVEKGITNGTDAMHFSPNEPCTRAQIVTFLYRLYAKA